MTFEHSVDGSDVMIHVVLVACFDIFKSVTRAKRDKLVQLICTVKFEWSEILDLGQRFEYQVKF